MQRGVSSSSVEKEQKALFSLPGLLSWLPPRRLATPWPVAAFWCFKEVGYVRAAAGARKRLVSN